LGLQFFYAALERLLAPFAAAADFSLSFAMHFFSPPRSVQSGRVVIPSWIRTATRAPLAVKNLPDIVE
jgi:hypothetical protein